MKTPYINISKPSKLLVPGHDAVRIYLRCCAYNCPVASKEADRCTKQNPLGVPILAITKALERITNADAVVIGGEDPHIFSGSTSFTDVTEVAIATHKLTYVETSCLCCYDYSDVSIDPHLNDFRLRVILRGGFAWYRDALGDTCTLKNREYAGNEDIPDLVARCQNVASNMELLTQLATLHNDTYQFITPVPMNETEAMGVITDIKEDFPNLPKNLWYIQKEPSDPYAEETDDDKALLDKLVREAGAAGVMPCPDV